jgi:steroid 5-alpha reductase family enzyme
MAYSDFLSLALMNLALIAVMMLALWGLSLALRDSSIADIFWGFGLAITAWFSAWLGDGVVERQQLVLTLITLWALRIGLYIGWRNWGGEDPRYAHLRRYVTERGGNYALHSLVHIYLQQGFFMWLVSLVLIFAVSSETPASLGTLAWVGVGLWCLGMFFETVGDWQLSRFRADPANAGRVMDRGLWRYTRHPNYFGEACVWVGFFAIAMENPAAIVTVISPAMMLWVLMGPLGKGLLERRMAKKRPEFAEYARRTSGFFPLPPKR